MRSQEYGQHMTKVMQNEYIHTVDIILTGFAASIAYRSLTAPSWKRVKGRMQQ